jgi:hypothetical protein
VEVVKIQVVSYFGKWYWWDRTERGVLSLKPATWLNDH